MATAEFGSSGRLESLPARRASNRLWPSLRNGLFLYYLRGNRGVFKIGDTLLQRVLDGQEVGESQKLEHLIYSGLDLSENHLATTSTKFLEERDEASDTRRRQIIEGAALEQDLTIACQDAHLDLALKVCSISGVDFSPY